MSNLLSRNSLSHVTLREIFATTAIMAGSVGYAFFNNAAEVVQKADKAGTTLSTNDHNDINSRMNASIILFSTAALATAACLATDKKKGNSPIF